MSDLQDAIKEWEDFLFWANDDAPEHEQTVVEAARKYADPDYEAAIDRWWAEVGDLMKPTISSSAIDRAVENAIKTALGIREDE